MTTELELKVIELVGKITQYSRHNMWKSIETEILILARSERNAALDEAANVKITLDGYSHPGQVSLGVKAMKQAILALKDKQ